MNAATITRGCSRVPSAASARVSTVQIFRVGVTRVISLFHALNFDGIEILLSKIKLKITHRVASSLSSSSSSSSAVSRGVDGARLHAHHKSHT